MKGAGCPLHRELKKKLAFLSDNRYIPMVIFMKIGILLNSFIFKNIHAW